MSYFSLVEKVGLEPTTYRLDRFAVSIPKMERVARIELANKPWQGFRLPLHHTRIICLKKKSSQSFGLPKLRRPDVTAPLYLSRLTWSDSICQRTRAVPLSAHVQISCDFYKTFKPALPEPSIVLAEQLYRLEHFYFRQFI